MGHHGFEDRMMNKYLFIATAEDEPRLQVILDARDIHEAVTTSLCILNMFCRIQDGEMYTESGFSDFLAENMEKTDTPRLTTTVCGHSA